MQRFMQNGCVKDSMPQIFTKNKKNVFTNGSIQQFTSLTIYIILIIKKKSTQLFMPKWFCKGFNRHFF